ncbi:hypothetical protein GCM10011332_32230 [Terasakiella brassicae]|uniref:Uncharacterized protein n=1 Tax=Terasakiella brassicae TaxID=1634917 RepID=A0A917C967_9PROT|nr:hypothetical protein [Terasakiella brassicae]GGF75766.1 hypothetical protein GCM10011332_32230 [Terasakiella brassicae]
MTCLTVLPVKISGTIPQCYIPNQLFCPKIVCNEHHIFATDLKIRKTGDDVFPIYKLEVVGHIIIQNGFGEGTVEALQNRPFAQFESDGITAIIWDCVISVGLSEARSIDLTFNTITTSYQEDLI